MTVRSSSLDLAIVVEEQLALAEPLVENPRVPHKLSGTERLTSTSVPDVVSVWSGVVALSAGAATLDLTALPNGPYATTVSLSGKKIRQFSVQATAANAGALKIAKGASNAIMLGGHVDDVITLPPGATQAAALRSGGLTIGNGAKALALTGTATDSVSIVIVAGTP